MKDSIRIKLMGLAERHEEVGVLLSDPDIAQDREKFQALSKEYAELGETVDCFKRYTETEAGLVQAEEMLKDGDAEIRDMAKEELQSLKADKAEIEADLEIRLLPKDPDDDKGVYLEVRAGTGGHEAALFAGDLARMYTRYAQKMGWQASLVNESFGEQGGYKEVVIQISGDNVYGHLKFESGGHRVQRIPVTESQGRIHTSACTVAVLPEVEAVDDIEISASDLRIDTYRASGAGGQHVNKTDSAVRITHLPTNTVVECQDERSQHKNKAKAMAVLQAKLLRVEKEQQEKAQADARKSLVGSGDRSERIRTYNFPQGRVSDHRINLTIYKLDEFMEGSVDMVIDPLRREYQMELLASLSGEGEG